MKNSRLSIRLVTTLFLVAAGLGSAATGSSSKLAAQATDKSLDIERYSNEPLELTELKIGEQSIRDKIATQSRRNDEGLDSVRFRENDGWFKTVWVKLRNVFRQANHRSRRSYLLPTSIHQNFIQSTRGGFHTF